MWDYKEQLTRMRRTCKDEDEEDKFEEEDKEDERGGWVQRMKPNYNILTFIFSA